MSSKTQKLRTEMSAKGLVLKEPGSPEARSTGATWTMAPFRTVSDLSDKSDSESPRDNEPKQLQGAESIVGQGSNTTAITKHQATVSSDSDEEPKKPLAIEAQSKNPFQSDDETAIQRTTPLTDEDAPIQQVAPPLDNEIAIKDPSTPLNKKSTEIVPELIYDWNQDLRTAVEAEGKYIAKLWINYEQEHNGGAMDIMSLYSDQSVETINAMLRKRLEKLYKANSDDLTEETWARFERSIAKGRYDLVEYIHDHAKLIMGNPQDNKKKTEAATSEEESHSVPLSKGEEGADLAAKPPVADVQKRQEINRVIGLRNRNGSYYEMLSVSITASTQEISKAYKWLSLLIHPDKNKDKEANACAQDINDANDVLTDDVKRKIYDQFLAKNPKPPHQDDFGEELAPNAYGEESDDDDDTQYESDLDIAKPNEKVQEYHTRMGEKLLPEFFDKLDKPSEQFRLLLDKVDILNAKIRKNNKTREDIPEDAYTVTREWLVRLQYWQRKLVNEYRVGINIDKSRLKELYSFYTKIAQESIRQWPVRWRDLIMNPVLRATGLSFDEAKPKRRGDGLPRKGGSSNSDGVNPDEDMNDAEDPGDNKSDAGDDGDHQTDEDMYDAEEEPVARIVETLKPGYTIFGEKILGYRVVKQFNKYMRVEQTRNMWFCVQGTGPNPLRYATASRIGIQAALEYHSLPDSKKTEIGSEDYRSRPVTDLKRIIGVACTSTICPIGQAPNTLVWVEMRNDPSPGKTHIMFRTALRKWQDQHIADKLIDDFFITKRIEPPWARPGAPINDSSSYQPLKWPLPSRARPLLPYDNYESNFQMRSRPQLPASSADPVAQISDLMKGFMQFMIEKEEKQEMRAEKERKEIKRLLLR